MPYITQDRRFEIRAGDLPKTAGELTFYITEGVGDRVLMLPDDPTDPAFQAGLEEAAAWLTHTVQEYVSQFETNYTLINEVMGALACAELETLRRCDVDQLGIRDAFDWTTGLLLGAAREGIYMVWAGPYEDLKIAENGDLPIFAA